MLEGPPWGIVTPGSWYMGVGGYTPVEGVDDGDAVVESSCITGSGEIEVLILVELVEDCAEEGMGSDCGSVLFLHVIRSGDPA